MRDRLLAALALFGFVLICVAAAATRRPRHAVPPVNYGTPSPHVSTMKPDQNGISDKPPKPFHLRIPHWLIVDLTYLLYTLVFGLIVFAIIKLVPYLSVEQRRRRRTRALSGQDDAPEEIDRETQDQLARTFSDALTGFDIGDANRAVVACWIRLEQIAEGAGFARQQWETSTDLITRWLSRASLPSEPLHRLAELYRQARYSGRPMSSEQIESARATLTELRIAFQSKGNRDSVGNERVNRDG